MREILLTSIGQMIKNFRKKKLSMESFKSYVDLDLNSDDSEKDNLSAAVSEPALSIAEPSSAANTMFESRTFDQGPLGRMIVDHRMYSHVATKFLDRFNPSRHLARDSALFPQEKVIILAIY